MSVVLLAATAWFASFLNEARPFGEWLFFDLAKIWGWELLLSAACVSTGHVVLVRILRIPGLPGLEKVALAFALGLTVFVTGIYLGGFAHVLGRVYGSHCRS
ncbi:MAG TPA: hypothetical protein VH062_18995 [Polyangiaceae bacterium]|nr:hypothetical protein [Polyangiaceae bacterium]